MAAVFLGFMTVFVLSLSTDRVLHMLNVYPPWGQTMYDTGLYLLALAYLAAIGTVVAIAGAVATIPMKLGPAWYPIVLAIISVPCVWLGGVLYQKRHAS